MSGFMDTAKAVEPVVRMLDDRNPRGFVSVRIFKDGSGSIIVPTTDADKVRDLLLAHGVVLDGHQDSYDKYHYHFDIDLGTLKKYSEMLCPHCGRDTKAGPSGKRA